MPSAFSLPSLDQGERSAGLGDGGHDVAADDVGHDLRRAAVGDVRGLEVVVTLQRLHGEELQRAGTGGGIGDGVGALSCAFLMKSFAGAAPKAGLVISTNGDCA